MVAMVAMGALAGAVAGGGLGAWAPAVRGLVDEVDPGVGAGAMLPTRDPRGDAVVRPVAGVLAPARGLAPADPGGRP